MQLSIAEFVLRQKRALILYECGFCARPCRGARASKAKHWVRRGLMCGLGAVCCGMTSVVSTKTLSSRAEADSCLLRSATQHIARCVSRFWITWDFRTKSLQLRPEAYQAFSFVQP